MQAALVALVQIAMIPSPKPMITVLLLLGSSVFMTFAWDGHMK
jgi:uncharacterized protein (DUF486 family)